MSTIPLKIQFIQSLNNQVLKSFINYFFFLKILYFISENNKPSQVNKIGFDLK